jgi:hemoglobin-like flavoprotein
VSPEQRQLVVETWGRVERDAERAAATFYARLFEIDPSTRPLFDATDMRVQSWKFTLMLGQIVRQLDSPSLLVKNVAASARRHVGYNVRNSQYDTAGEALLWTLEQLLGAGFTPEVRAAWSEAYTLTASIMRRASERVTGEHRAVRP